MVDYEWYGIVSGSELQQGDFIFDVEVPVVRGTKHDEFPVEIETFDTIVLTQSCDIGKKAVEHIVLCPVWDIKVAARFNPQFKTLGGLERLRKGQVIAFHLLNKCSLPGYERDLMIVQFERIIVRPKDTVLELVSLQQNRLRLLPPYREEMAQRFGIFFARVGLPIEISSFTS